MKISTKGRYALRLMVDLALHNNGEKIAMKTIAKRQDISIKYMEQIIALLSAAKLVKSSRGAQGGYQLACDPAKTTVGDILRLTEGSLSPVVCIEDGQCERIAQCATYEVWKKLGDAINQVVDGYTLNDLVEIDKSKRGNDYII